MVDARVKQFKELYEKKAKAKAMASVQKSNEVKDDVNDEEATGKTRKKGEVREIKASARYVTLPSGNTLIFD
jgi:hypothetical protein